MAKKSTALVNYDKEMADEAKQLQERIQVSSGNVIRLGKDKTFRLPDGTSSKDPMECVILDYTYRNLFYGSTYDEKNPVPPDCFSISRTGKDMEPSDNSPDKQADTCGECPNNQFGSKGRGKACKNTRWVALLPPDADSETPIAYLSIPPTSIQEFDAYVKSVAASFQRPPVGVVTMIAFDPTVDYQKLRFGKPSPNTSVAEFMARRAEAKTVLESEPDLTQRTPKQAPGRAKARPVRR